MTQTRTVLFLCTGNFYRSRFAEAVFNHHAAERGLSWRAFSRGLNLKPQQKGLSPLARQALEARGIPLEQCGPECQTLTDADLQGAGLIIALKEAEHRPMVVRHFAEWENRIRFWHVSDVDEVPADEALPEIERKVRELLEELEAS
ncbi:MAG: low molecular weight phosphatase family protein [Armatimonadota bacterium]